MSIASGSIKLAGVVIGQHIGQGPIGQEGVDKLTVVVARINQQFGRKVKLTGDWWTVGPLRNLVRSRVFQSTDQGVVVRVINGAGFVHVGGGKHSLNYGDWAYVPAGLAYSFEGAMVSGLNFRVMHCGLTAS